VTCDPEASARSYLTKGTHHHRLVGVGERKAQRGTVKRRRHDQELRYDEGIDADELQQRFGVPSSAPNETPRLRLSEGPAVNEERLQRAEQPFGPA
jgi:hypothetical protein